MDKAALRLTLFGLLFTCVNLAATNKKIDIYSFHINSTITSRYATTVITSRVKNLLKHSQEVKFEVKIPKNAFISQFRMTIEGKTYDGVVKDKEEAQREYRGAVSRGESAGLTSAVGRTLEDFKTSVTVAALSKVTFELTYEELLKRRLGKYELLINAQPMQLVAGFKIDVHIHENQGISFSEVKGGLNTKDLANAVTHSKADKDIWVRFYPTLDQQTKCVDCSKNGLNGNLIIMYDVERLTQSGDLMVSNGYFVHCFAPTDIQSIPKNMVFIIDQSGSMRGKKNRAGQFLFRILSDLAEDDLFGLITFSSRIQTWKPELLKATEGNVEEAKTFVKRITAEGKTDINAAVLKAVDMINSLRNPQKGSASILILLTDGYPISGVTDPVKIQQNVKKAIGGKFPLYSLGFGFDVSFDFLEKLSLENKGVARRIYEDSDADLQLQGFYKEVATPLLTDVHLSYQGVDKLTQSTFSQYYNGSEIMVAGHIIGNSLDIFTTEVTASSERTKVVYHISVPMEKLNSDRPEENIIERLWAFLTVKQLLEKELLLNGLEKDNAKKEALELSLKYRFVTPLTSMVVTKPQGEKMQVAHKPKEGEKPNTSPFGGSLLKLASIIRILKSSGNAKPLCYDVPPQKVRLLQNDLSEFSMNGQLESGKGFSQIAVHYKTNHRLLLSTSEITYFDGQDTVKFSWDQDYTHHENEHVSLILQSNEMDVTMGNMRFVILLHKKDEVFLWPAIWQQPKDVGFTGILGEADIKYEEIPGSQTPTLKLKDKEVKTSWVMVRDYRLPSAPVVGCWLVPFQVVAQRELSDFTVTQL
ncbi:unnamed protein product [Leuciscus chuanchicus]